MPTRAGFATLIVGLALIAAGRVFGLLELFVLGLGAVGLVGAALVWVWIYKGSLQAHRTVTPAAVHLGQTSDATLHLTNRRLLPTPVLRVFDEVEGTRGAELEVPPLRRSAPTTAMYRLPTQRRGVVPIGPLSIITIDPFGLCQRTAVRPETAELIVYPHIDAIVAPPRPSGEDQQLVDRRPTGLGRSSSDFYSLRDYVVGDDLRRVHWPSSARQDELVVRQDQMPQQGRSTVLLETIEGSTDRDTFEAMVSAAASLVVACFARDDLVRLVLSDGTDTGVVGDNQRARLLEMLARVTPQPLKSGEAPFAGAEAVTGTAIAVVSNASANLLAQTTVGPLARAIVVMFGSGPTSTSAGHRVRSSTVISVRGGEQFATRWTTAFGPTRSRRGRRGAGS